MLMIRYTKSALRRSRTLAFGSATILAPVPTTCTRSIGRCRGQKRWMLSTKTWPQDIELALGQSTYDSDFVPPFRLQQTDSLWDHRSSKSSSSRKPMMSSAPTLNSSSPRTSNSLFPIACPRPPARLCSPLTDLPRSLR